MVGIMSAMMIFIGVFGISGLKTARDGLQTLYKDRVVPLKDLNIISDLYAVNIVDTTHITRNGNITWDEAASASEELSSQAAALRSLMGCFQLKNASETIIQQPAPIQQEIPEKKADKLPKMITLADDDFGKYEERNNANETSRVFLGYGIMSKVKT